MLREKTQPKVVFRASKTVMFATVPIQSVNKCTERLDVYGDEGTKVGYDSSTSVTYITMHVIYTFKTTRVFSVSPHSLVPEQHDL